MGFSQVGMNVGWGYDVVIFLVYEHVERVGILSDVLSVLDCEVMSYII